MGAQRPESRPLKSNSASIETPFLDGHDMPPLNRAVLLMPYFGKLPPYFGTYLNSLAGKRFDVMWISDLDVDLHPDNFKIVRMTFDEFRARAESQLATRVSISDGRRLCDFRPMYATIFADLIAAYDYWGWGDCDLVYGRKFNDFLARTVETGNYDAISMHRDFMSGPTCFYRNTKQMRELYLKTNNWREVCAFEGSGQAIRGFDECGGHFHAALMRGAMTMEQCAGIRDNMSAVVWREPGLNVYREDEIDEQSLADGEVVEMRGDTLTVDGREISLFHFVLAKAPRWFRIGNVSYADVRDYRIDTTGFYHGVLAWRTRHVRRPCRKLIAAYESLRNHGLRHIRRRIGV